MAQALSVAFTPTPLGATEKLVIEATPQVSQGKNFMPRSSYKLVAVSTTSVASPYNALAAYTALFGALVSGKKIFVRCRVITTGGFSGTPFLQNIIVT